MNETTISDPLIEGAENIGYELYGNRDSSTCRRVFYLLEQGHIRGAFKMGNKWAARLSVLHNVGRAD